MARAGRGAFGARRSGQRAAQLRAPASILSQQQRRGERACRPAHPPVCDAGRKSAGRRGPAGVRACHPRALPAPVLEFLVKVLFAVLDLGRRGHCCCAMDVRQACRRVRRVCGHVRPLAPCRPWELCSTSPPNSPPGSGVRFPAYLPRRRARAHRRAPAPARLHATPQHTPRPAAGRVGPHCLGRAAVARRPPSLRSRPPSRFWDRVAGRVKTHLDHSQDPVVSGGGPRGSFDWRDKGP